MYIYYSKKLYNIPVQVLP